MIEIILWVLLALYIVGAVAVLLRLRRSETWTGSGAQRIAAVLTAMMWPLVPIVSAIVYMIKGNRPSGK